MLFDLGADVLIARVTSALHREPEDVAVADWRAAGLLKPSTVRLARLVTVDKSLLLRKFGTLGPADRAAITARWNQRMRLGG